MRPGLKATCTCRSESITVYPPPPWVRSSTSASSPPGAGYRVERLLPGDRHARPGVAAALGPDLEGVLEELNVPGGQSAVDLRCEEGYFTASLPYCLARPCTVYAMNMDAELTEHARRHVAERGRRARCVRRRGRYASGTPCFRSGRFRAVSQRLPRRAAQYRARVRGAQGARPWPAGARSPWSTGSQRPARRLRYYGAVFVWPG